MWTNDARPADCPICGLPATSGTQHRDGDTCTASYLCPLDHLWQTKWLAPDTTKEVA